MLSPWVPGVGTHSRGHCEVGDHKHLQVFGVPVVRAVGNVEALLPHAAITLSNGNSSDTVSICQAGGEQLSARPRPLGVPAGSDSAALASAAAPQSKLAVLRGDGEEAGRGSGGTTQEPLAT